MKLSKALTQLVLTKLQTSRERDVIDLSLHKAEVDAKIKLAKLRDVAEFIEEHDDITEEKVASVTSMAKNLDW